MLVLQLLVLASVALVGNAFTVIQFHFAICKTSGDRVAQLLTVRDMRPSQAAMTTVQVFWDVTAVSTGKQLPRREGIIILSNVGRYLPVDTAV